MAEETFPSYPPCCRKVLAELADEGKQGSRTCERGHTVNLSVALQTEARAREKAKGNAGA